MSLDLFNLDRADWMHHEGRKCVSSQPDLWFPAESYEKAATKLCDGCPVVNECATYAIERPELEGVWGATTTLQRQIARRKADAA